MSQRPPFGALWSSWIRFGYYLGLKFIGLKLYTLIILEFFSEAPLDESSYYVVASQHAKAVIQRCSVKTGVYENFTKFTGKHLCQSLFFNKVAGLRLGKLRRSLVTTSQIYR